MVVLVTGSLTVTGVGLITGSLTITVVGLITGSLTVTVFTTGFSETVVKISVSVKVTGTTILVESVTMIFDVTMNKSTPVPRNRSCDNIPGNFLVVITTFSVKVSVITVTVSGGGIFVIVSVIIVTVSGWGFLTIGNVETLVSFTVSVRVTGTVIVAESVTMVLDVTIKLSVEDDQSYDVTNYLNE